ncbi:MAG: flavodoxin family protein, partial [Dysosmobacter sp.]|nr:flavodoxin family protein [Dysosmobacter sp.]
MKVTVITGSPHKHGTSALLADEFIRGAQEAGWKTF